MQSIKTLMIKALNSDYGISLSFKTYGEAKFYRRRFYNYRDKLRSEGNADFDGLSFIVKSGSNELFIINRSIISPVGDSCPSSEVRELKPSEVPNTINARGKSKVGTYDTIFKDILEGKVT